MGQQQLLLLVLGIVIVGLAVVVGIEAFSENKTNSTVDAMVNEIVRVGSDLQAWSLKPQAFGGPSDGEGFTGVTFGSLGYPVGIVAGENAYTTTTATYFMQTASATADCVVVTGISKDGVTGGELNGSELAAWVSIKITGSRPEDIMTHPGDDLLTC